MTDWAKRGVWVSVGMVIGVLASTVFQAQPVNAVGTSGGFEGGLIATGASQNNAVEFVWHLDDRGMLSCHLMGAQGRNVSAPPIDVKQAMNAKGGKKGKYAMVTGRYTVQGQISDVLYMTESTSKSIAVFNFSNDGIRLVGTLGGSAPR